MATTAVNNENLTLLDLVKRTDPDGKAAPIVEALSRQSSVIKDAVFKEGNLATGHQFTTRTGLPSVGFRRFNEGTTRSKSKTDTITEACAMISAQSAVDCELAKLNGNEAAYRMGEDMAFLQALTKKAEDSIIYSNTKTAPEEFMGLSPRLNAKSGAYGNQIIQYSSGESGSDQTSIWLVGWGERTVYGIYPKGSVGGLVPTDMGMQMVDDGTGKTFRAYVTDWTWKLGLCVEDARYLVRIANIDTSALVGTGHLLHDAMTKAVNRLHGLEGIKPVFYVNRTVKDYLELQSVDATRNSTLTYENVGGKPIPSFRGIPIHVTDSILDTEDVIT